MAIYFEITWEALGTIYPESFVYKSREAAPKGYWKVPANRIQFIEKLAAKYSILDRDYMGDCIGDSADGMPTKP